MKKIKVVKKNQKYKTAKIICCTREESALRLP
jgi:hypothetical protein